MRFDFGPVRRKELHLAAWAQLHEIAHADLIAFTNDMIDAQLALLEGLPDGFVAYVPEDPDADDPYAVDVAEMTTGWSLGHVIAHVTASSEECCAHAAALARGVTPCGRDRYETPWQKIDTTAAARQRLQESRRIQLAYFAAWPDHPHLEITYTPAKSAQNCIIRALVGLFHGEGHLAQMREAIRQAAAATTTESYPGVSLAASKPKASLTI